MKNIILPPSLINCWNKNILVGVIQFGSSIYLDNPNDIDLAVVVRSGHYKEFLKNIVHEDFSAFDISLILEDECSDWQKFRFGSHGIHLIPSFKEGMVLLGENIFLNAPNFTQNQIRESVFLRLNDYEYILRKSIFKPNLLEDVKKRWNKFLRLALFLIDDEIEYPQILRYDNNRINELLERNKLQLNSGDIINSMEYLWAKILQKRQSL